MEKQGRKPRGKNRSFDERIAEYNQIIAACEAETNKAIAKKDLYLKRKGNNAPVQSVTETTESTITPEMEAAS
jgi:hypothetical protein